MMLELNGETIDTTIDDLFKDDEVENQEASTPLAKNKPEGNTEDMTAAVSKRINEVRSKTEAKVKDEIAKELGFENYDAMQKAKENKTITEAGFNPEDIEKLIGPMLEKRLANDPRMVELQSFKERERQELVKSELAKIEALTGLKIAEADLPQETLDLVAKGVPLSKAYLATNSDKIIAAGTKGSTEHMASGTGSGGVKHRGLTQSEKALYRQIYPDITDEELSKKLIDVEQK